MWRRTFFFWLAVSAGSAAWAHPTSYKGATSVMAWNQPFLNEFMTTYSFRSNAAVAGQYMRMDMEDGEMKLYLPQLNLLARRWNADDSQANIYVMGGWGGYEFEGRKKTAGYGALESDWESRRFLISGKFTGVAPSFGKNVYHAQGRLGVAAYESEFDEIASWFIVEVQHNTQLEHTVNVTPLLRFFYRNMLAEIGSSLEGDALFNFMVHF